MYLLDLRWKGKYLDRLDELNEGDETAKLAYEEKKRGFHFVANTKRWQATEVDYDCFASVNKSARCPL